jgi:hypothetical protein
VALRPRGADLAEHGLAGVRTAAVWGQWKALDAALGGLTSLRIPLGGEALTFAHAFARLGEEPLREQRNELAQALARTLPSLALDLAGTWALVADDAATAGAPELVSARTLDCARRLLAAGDDAVHDLLAWATRRLGRPTRSPIAWHDVARLLRNPSLDGLFVGRDPWVAMGEWRALWQQTGGPDSRRPAETESMAAALEQSGEDGDVGFGAWALRGRRQSRIGASAWPHASQHRFALLACGLWDTLREAGSAALLPLDEAAASLAAALWPPLLAEPPYLTRVLHQGSTGPDDLRLLSLAEAIFNRLEAAAVLVLEEFQRTRSVAQAVAAAEVHFRRAVGAPVRPELGLLFCRPWGGPGVSARPDAVLAAHTLREALRREHDVDWWRNPRSAEPLRALWARSATEPLEALVVGFDAAAAETSLRAWIDERLGG